MHKKLIEWNSLCKRHTMLLVALVVNLFCYDALNGLLNALCCYEGVLEEYTGPTYRLQTSRTRIDEIESWLMLSLVAGHCDLPTWLHSGMPSIT